MAKIDWPTFRKKAPSKLSGFPTGTRVYKGFQGSGKTLSMVHYAKRILADFPDCECYSNIRIFDEPRVKNFSTTAELTAIMNSDPGETGLLLLVDEAHLFFNKTSGIPLDFLAVISQQRKRRFHIILSSQIWEELDISLRKQVKTIVNCYSIFRTIIVNQISDGETLSYDKKESKYVARPIGTEIFHMTKELVESYDTFQRISTNSEYQPGLSRGMISSEIVIGNGDDAGRGSAVRSARRHRR